MTSMNVSLPVEMKAYVDDRVSASSYQSSSEYVRDLIRRDQEAIRIRALVEEGLSSPVAGQADAAWFDQIRASIRR